MYGRAINKLSVYIQAPGQDEMLIWKKSGNNGNIWNKVQIDIFSNKDYYVRKYSLVTFK